MRFQQNPLWIRSALAAVFVSPAKPRSRPPRLLACHNYSSQSSGASSILLFKASGAVIYASKIAPCPRLRPIAHGTFPRRWATSGVDFVQPSSRSPRSPQSEITLWAAETYSTRGYAPLIVTLANTREVLYLVNRPGNAVSHEGCVPWIDRAIELVRPRAGEITLRGDTDFT